MSDRHDPPRMIDSVLTVCTGNICRSPLGAALLRAGLGTDRMRIASAGIGARAGAPAYTTTLEIARANGLDLEDHVARQFTASLGQKHSLILAMNTGHRHAMMETAPQLSGRIMLFDHWTGAAGIPDPYGHARAIHEDVFARLEMAAQAWTQRLATGQP